MLFLYTMKFVCVFLSDFNVTTILPASLLDQVVEIKKKKTKFLHSVSWIDFFFFLFLFCITYQYLRAQSLLLFFCSGEFQPGLHPAVCRSPQLVTTSPLPHFLYPALIWNIPHPNSPNNLFRFLPSQFIPTYPFHFQFINNQQHTN